MRLRSVLLALCAPLAACGGAPAAPEAAPAEPAAAAEAAPAAESAAALQAAPVPVADAPPAGEPAPGSTVSQSGTLRHDPIPQAKSIEAYMGREFLVVSDGGELLVEPKDAAMREQLVALAGKRVHVECVVRRPPPPDPMSSYPMGADGGPMRRPDFCVIEALRAE